MIGFFTGIEATVKGYTVDEAEMKYTPKDGRAVLNRRVGCGGSDKRPATFVNIQLWGATAEKMNEVASAKGLAIEAKGMIEQRRWQYNNKWYDELRLVFVSECRVQISEKEFEDLPIEKKEKRKFEKAEVEV